MNGETALAHIESKLDKHIEQHTTDTRKLLLWAIGILIGMIGSVATGFITYGSMQEEIRHLSDEQANFVTQAEYRGLISLFDEKFRNINEKLDKIISATR